MNQVHLQTVLASKAARVVAAAAGRAVVDFGLRRMHGTDAGMKWQAPVARSAPPRRRMLPSQRELPPEAAVIFGVVRQMMRY